jgi:predicted Ser/Thr protein kinase
MTLVQGAGCLSFDVVQDLVEGRLPQVELGRVQVHVDECVECRQLLAASARAVHPRETIAKPRHRIGRYLVERVVGFGATGVVYAAVDPELGRAVALKLLHDRAREDIEPARQRIAAEAQAMAKLSHPNVVTVHDVGEIDGELFFAMELVDGVALSQWLADEPRSKKAILEVFTGAGLGLAAAHAAGVVHRDFKPDNVLIGLDGRPRVTDFGLARTREISTDALAQGGARALDRTSTLVGTPLYMAPEQFAGAPSSAASDQFAFSVALYEALYETRPFEAATFEQLVGGAFEWRTRSPPVGRGVPARVRRALLRGLSADPRARFPSMSALVGELGSNPRARAGSWIAFALMIAALVFAWRVEHGRRLATTPTNAEAARLYESGLALLRADDARTAMTPLAAALAIEPGFARGHITLSSAARLAGDVARSKREAERAVAISRSLPLEARLLSEAALHAAHDEWSQAEATYRSLFSVHADDLELGLALAEAERGAGHESAALELVAALHRLPAPAGDDPRIDLEEAAAAHATNDFARALEVTRRVAARASSIPTLWRRALIEQGLASFALGDLADARKALEAARAAETSHAEDPEIDEELARVSAGSGDLTRATALAAHALEVQRQAGPPVDLARALTVHANLIGQTGDAQASKRELEEALSIYRGAEKRELTAETLGLLGALAYDGGLLGEAITDFEQEAALYRELNLPNNLALPLSNIASARLHRGELADAQRTDEAAAASLRALGDRENLVDLDVSLGSLLATRGDSLGAQQHFEESRRLAESLHLFEPGLWARYAQAGLELDEGAHTRGLADARQVLEAAEAHELSELAALAKRQIAGALLTENQGAAARRMIASAGVPPGLSRETHLTIALIDAQVAASTGLPADVSRAEAAMQALLREARRAGYFDAELEIRLALGELAVDAHRAGARASLLALAEEARDKGFVHLAHDATTQAARAAPRSR